MRNGLGLAAHRPDYCATGERERDDGVFVLHCRMSSHVTGRVALEMRASWQAVVRDWVTQLGLAVLLTGRELSTCNRLRRNECGLMRNNKG